MMEGTEGVPTDDSKKMNEFFFQSTDTAQETKFIDSIQNIKNYTMATLVE